MITKEEFIDLILKQQEWSNRIDEVSEALNVPTLFESDWVEYTSVLFDKTLDLLFNEDGIAEYVAEGYEISIGGSQPDQRSCELTGRKPQRLRID